MSKSGPLILTIALCAFMSSCNGGGTSPTTVSYDGQWIGTTFQGRPIAFTVSSDQKVTAITIE